MSGAGRTKGDYIRGSAYVEVKDAVGSYRLKYSDLHKAWVQATRQGQDEVEFVILVRGHHPAHENKGYKCTVTVEPIDTEGLG